MNATISHPSAIAGKSSLTTALLICGILSSLYYIGINIYVPTEFEGYDIASQAPSELSAIDAPTRQLWVILATLYVLLFAAFGWGILRLSGENRLFRIMGWLIIAYSLINFYWPPMHLRGVERSMTDTLHIVWAAAAVLFMMLFMGFGAAAIGGRFRIYTIVSLLLFVLFGVLTSLEAPKIATNEPTPLMGIWERINIGIFMIWVMVLAFILLRREKSRFS